MPFLLSLEHKLGGEKRKKKMKSKSLTPHLTKITIYLGWLTIYQLYMNTLFLRVTLKSPNLDRTTTFFPQEIFAITTHEK